jgi:hypothetical protein
MQKRDELPCVSCGAPVAGLFCATCGEQQLQPGDRSVTTFLKESLADVVSLDSKLYRTIVALATKPGQLTREFMAGRRVPYVRPLQLFLLANLIYFVVHPTTRYSGHITPLQSQMDEQFYSQMAGIRGIVEREVATRGVAFETFQERFDTKTEIYAKSLILLMVPMFAAVVALLQVGKRCPLLEHLVFATHYFAWELIVVSSLFLLVYSWLVLPLIADAFRALHLSEERAPGGILWTFFGDMPTTLLIVPYLMFAFRRVYADSWAGAVLRALLCVPLLLVVMIAYRYLLFWITFLAM